MVALLLGSFPEVSFFRIKDRKSRTVSHSNLATEHRLEIIGADTPPAVCERLAHELGETKLLVRLP